GTAQGTTLLANGTFQLRGPATLGNHYYFIELVGGGNLWRSDGTVQGTTQVKANVRMSEAGVLDAKLYFVNQTTPGLWETDGTDLGTVPVMAFPNVGGKPPGVWILAADRL